MQLFNTLTKNVSEITHKDNHVKIYSCGPTVYDRAHIGNLASFIYADLLGRTLRAQGHRVTHVMNLTDIDDKTIARSQQEHPELEPMEALATLTKHYEALFLEDLAKIGVDTNSIVFTRATDYIPSMQAMIVELIEANLAYISDDGIYFSIAMYKDSGKIYGQLVEITADSTGSARVNNDEYDKDNIHDFALWKKQKPGEPAWDFSVSNTDMTGRPGWHIECSAMSKSELGIPFDIHTGGIDLKFPHHENEIAQSTALADIDVFSHTFMHSEHILVDGQKMSKSLNNFLTLDDIVQAGYDPAAFRMLVLEGHYRNQRNYSQDILNAAANRLKHWKQTAAMVRHISSEQTADVDLQEAQIVMTKIADDLNSPEALKEIDALFTQFSAEGQDSLPKISVLIKLVASTFGIDLLDFDESVDELIKQREAARASQDWARADDIRAELDAKKIGINDTAVGPIWYKL